MSVEVISELDSKVCDLLANKKNVIVMIGSSDPQNVEIQDVMFQIDKFKENPQEVIDWIADKLDKPRAPDVSHKFLAELADRGQLLRAYTINLDKVEEKTGIPNDYVFNVRGTFFECSCLDCKAPQNVQRVHKDWSKRKISKCNACKGVVRPNILFFGENIPEKYNQQVTQDITKCDCFILLGSNFFRLAMFDAIINLIPDSVPRIIVDEKSVDLNVLKSKTIEEIQELLKKVDEQRKTIEAKLNLLTVDTSARDVHVVKDVLKFSRSVMDSWD